MILTSVSFILSHHFQINLGSYLFMAMSLQYVLPWWLSGKESCYPGGTSGKESACQCRRREMWVWSLGWEDSLEEGTATHSSILACRIPWTEEHGSYIVHGVAKSQLWLKQQHACIRQCRRCGFDPWVRKIPWRKNGNPFLPGKSYRQRSLAGYSSWHHEELGTT